MVLAVVALHRHVDHREAMHATAGHRLLDAGLHGAHVVAWDRTADDGVDEREPLAALQRCDTQVDDRELTVTAALLLQLALGSCRAPDGFTVGHTDVGGVDVDAELARHALQRHRQVRVAEAAQHRLAGLLHALHPQRRVFRLQPTEGVAHLVVVALRARHDCHAVLRRGSCRRDHLHRRALRRQRVAGVGVAQLGDGGDVAGSGIGDRQLLLAAQHQQGVQSFLAAM